MTKGFLRPDDYKQDEEIYDRKDVIGLSLSNGQTYEVQHHSFYEKTVPVPPEHTGQQPALVQMFFFTDAFSGNRVIGLSKAIVSLELTPEG